MHINTFDHYQTLNSPLHRLDPRVKISLTVLFILSNVLLPDGAWLGFAASWLLIIIGSRIAKLGMRFILTRSLVAIPFALAAISAVFVVPGSPSFTLTLGPWSLTATDAGLVRRILRESGIIEVGNSIHTIRRGESLLHIAGLDDYWEHKDRLDFVLKNLPPEGAAILLIHEPDFADISAATGRFDLQLSGHSHGGQVILPFFGPLVLPLYARKYPLGIYRVGQMFQYTNRGIGTIPPAIRFNCRPEITLLTLKSERV